MLSVVRRKFDAEAEKIGDNSQFFCTTSLLNWLVFILFSGDDEVDNGKLIERRIKKAKEELQDIPEQCEIFSRHNFISRASTDMGGEAASPKQSLDVYKARSYFYSDIKNCLSSSMPASILSCIQSLPLEIKDWPNQDVFYRTLLNLLSDQGYLFFELGGSAKGNFSAQDITAIIADPNSNLYKEINLNESMMISNIRNKFWNCYYESDESGDSMPRALKRLEQSVVSLQSESSNSMPGVIKGPAQKDFFHSCIVKMVHRSPRNVKEEQPSSEELITFCKKQWGISDELLNQKIETAGLHQFDCSLQEVLTRLGEICDEQFALQNRTLQNLSTFDKVSEDFYDKYRKSRLLYKTLDEKFQCPTLILCSSSYLPQYVKTMLLDWYYRPDTVDSTKIKVQRKSDQHLPSDFPFSKIDFTADLQTRGTASFKKLRARIISILIDYRYREKGQKANIPPHLESTVNSILALSFVIPFSIGTDDIDVSDTSITLGPVISYLVIRQCKSIMDKPLDKIPMSILISAAEMKICRADEKTAYINSIIDDLRLYSGLRTAYSEFYKKRCDKEVLEKWDSAFLVYSGYRKLYTQPDLIYMIETQGEEFPVLYSTCFNKIRACLVANRPTLVHSSVTQINWEGSRDSLNQFHPTGPGDPGWLAVDYFRSLLADDHSNNPESCLNQFVKLLMKPYSHRTIQRFNTDCLISLIGTDEKEECKAICEKYGLLDVFSNGNPDDLCHQMFAPLQLMVVLEYTMRHMLEQSCCEFLYKWLTDYIDVKCKENLTTDGLL